MSAQPSSLQPVRHCLVTGASGFLGKHLCEWLQREQVTVRAVLRTAQPGPWHESGIHDIGSAVPVPAELFSGIDTIFYLASIAHNQAPVADYQRVNVDGCLQFARAALQAGVKRFVYVSSTRAVAIPVPGLVDEHYDAMPRDHYGLSKRKAEQGLLAMNGFDHLVIARPPLIYGTAVKGNLLRLMQWIDRGIFPPLPDINNLRSMVSADDLSRALLLLAQQPSAHRQVYFITDNIPYTSKRIENSIRRAFGRNVPRWQLPLWLFTLAGKVGDEVRKLLPAFPADTAGMTALFASEQFSSRKISAELGWQPGQTFDDVLPLMVAAYRRQRGCTP